jgi:hypothetical protein
MHSNSDSERTLIIAGAFVRSPPPSAPSSCFACQPTLGEEHLSIAEIARQRVARRPQ